MCVVIVFITQVILKVFFNYIIIQSLLFTSLKLREYFLSDNIYINFECFYTIRNINQMINFD